MDESSAFSVYKTFPFASAWDKLKLPKELKLDIDPFKDKEDPSEDHTKGPI